jgi:hypothetical protein
MERVDDHFAAAADSMKSAARVQAYFLTQFVATIFGRCSWRTMLAVVGNICRLLLESAAERHIELLKAAAREKARNAALERKWNNLQRRFVAQLVKRTIAPFIRLLSISCWVNVALPARYEEAIEPLKQSIYVDRGRNRENSGYSRDNLQNGVDRRGGRSKQRLLLYQKRLGQNTDDGSAMNPFWKDWPPLVPSLFDMKCDRVRCVATVANALLHFGCCGAEAQSKPTALLGILRINPWSGRRGLHDLSYR